MKTLSIVIPAFDEEKFIGTLLERIRAVRLEASGFRAEIIVVDDGSRDRTFEIASGFSGVRCIRQNNQGKGAAVQRGIQEAQGDYVIVQDADLEYDPQDYLPMLEKLSVDSGAVVYGSRFLSRRSRGEGWRLPGKHPQQGIGPWVANVALSIWIFLLFQRWITDPLTAYKLYPLPLIRQLRVRSKGFEADHEMTAKIIRRSVPIIEVPVRYSPRSYAEGKKIRAIDGMIAFWRLLEYRFRKD